MPDDDNDAKEVMKNLNATMRKLWEAQLNLKIPPYEGRNDKRSVAQFEKQVAMIIQASKVAPEEVAERFYFMLKEGSEAQNFYLEGMDSEAKKWLFPDETQRDRKSIFGELKKEFEGDDIKQDARRKLVELKQNHNESLFYLSLRVQELFNQAYGKDTFKDAETKQDLMAEYYLKALSSPELKAAVTSRLEDSAKKTLKHVTDTAKKQWKILEDLQKARGQSGEMNEMLNLTRQIVSSVSKIDDRVSSMEGQIKFTNLWPRNE